MKSFYQEWLRKNNEENIAAQTSQDTTPTTMELQPVASTSQAFVRGTSPSRSVPVPPSEVQETMAESNPSTSSNITKPTDLVFENDNFQLYLQKEAFMRQKRFNLQDHLFHIKIKMKNNSGTPYLKDIIDFLEQGLLYIMENIKQFYNTEDANVCFLTLFQEPMINALNSGMK
jgi:hypothetical protein